MPSRTCKCGDNPEKVKNIVKEAAGIPFLFLSKFPQRSACYGKILIIQYCWIKDVSNY